MPNHNRIIESILDIREFSFVQFPVTGSKNQFGHSLTHSLTLGQPLWCIGLRLRLSLGQQSQSQSQNPVPYGTGLSDISEIVGFQSWSR